MQNYFLRLRLTILNLFKFKIVSLNTFISLRKEKSKKLQLHLIRSFSGYALMHHDQLLILFFHGIDKAETQLP